MKTCLPVLVVRTKSSTAAIEMNGTFMGDASPSSHIALPLSENGDYYIGVNPLCNGLERYYPVVRKLSFIDGKLNGLICDDVETYAWPGSVYEAVFTPGLLPSEPEPQFPFIVAQLSLWEEYEATLFYENGLRMSIEDTNRVRFGAMLGPYKTGCLYQPEEGLLIAIAGEPKLPKEEAPDCYGNVLIAVDGDFNELLRIRADAVGFEQSAVISFTRLNTLQRHDKKQVYRYNSGTFFMEEPTIGFYTHSPGQPDTGRALIRAFCEAVMHGLWEEVFSYLTPALQEGLTKEIITDLLGNFVACRTPFTRQESAMGLVYERVNGIQQVRVFVFELQEGKIDNLAEEE